MVATAAVALHVAKQIRVGTIHGRVRLSPLYNDANVRLLALRDGTHRHEGGVRE